MAKVSYTDIIEDTQGALSKDGVIFRRKHFKVNAKGKCVAGKPEVYMRRKERNYTTNPVTEAEYAHQQRFAWAAKQADIELNDPVLRSKWEERLEKQLQKPEPGNTKIYVSLRGFIKAMLLKGSTIK